ncbi:MAG: hypothetical protein CBC42_04355 [Betaproteobacteria bacterium TMED82]|nr:MAG: hypothetical protein CBC42_04355 [Betaproteobacteria bacterium TMED82]
MKNFHLTIQQAKDKRLTPYSQIIPKTQIKKLVRKTLSMITLLFSQTNDSYKKKKRGVLLTLIYGS